MAVTARWRLGAQRTTHRGADPDVDPTEVSAEAVTARPPSSFRSAAVQAGVSALTLGVLLHFRDGYHAGSGEQLTLSVPGLHWAQPGWFAGHVFGRTTRRAGAFVRVGRLRSKLSL